MATGIEKELDKGLEGEKEQIEEDMEHHWSERNRLDEKLRTLQHQLQESSDGRTKKLLKEEISITQVKREIAESKRKKADTLSMQRHYEQLRMMSNAELLKKEGEKWEIELKMDEEHLKKLESEKKKRKQYEEEKSKKQSEKLLHEALKDGFVDVIIVVCIVLGQPGVGKTHLKYLLLDRRPPDLRTSTICAETPVRVEIRTVSGTKIENIRGKWKEVSNEDMLDIVARMILLAEPQFHQKSEHSIISKLTNLFMLHDQGAAGAKLPTLKHSRRRRNFRQRNTKLTVSDRCQNAIDLIVHKIVQRISMLKSNTFPIQSQGEPCDGCSSGQSVGDIVLKSKWVYFTDSGGQPQYHELLPLFVRCISSALCVTRLTDKLDEVQVVEYYQDGKQVGATQQSQLSAKDTIQCLVNTIQSYSSQDQPPKVIMIGTHLDKLEEMCSKQSSCLKPESKMQSSATVETVEEKDKKLLDMLKPEFINQLVFPSNDMTKLLFTLNTLNPGVREEMVAKSIRYAIETSGAKQVNIPIWWYIMELLLQELAKELGRGVLSRAECLEMARFLGIREDSFDVALEFFDELNVIKYSPDILPNVVFIESQIPLDKVSELVSLSFLLRQPQSGTHPSPLEGEWKHFRDRGIISKACLRSEHFSQHYVPGIFSVDDLCRLLKHLLVFAPVPDPVSIHQDNLTSSMSWKGKETHFVMPSALESLLEAALAQYRDSSSEILPLLIRFSQGSRRAGVFCCFVVHLIRYFGWRRILDDTQPLYRNCIKVNLPTDPPCTITLIDSNSLIEVYVKLATGALPSKCSALLNVIKNAILSGIDAACIALNYKQTKPEFTFYCQHPQPPSQTSAADQSKEFKQHTATLNDKKSFLTCDLVRDYSYPLQAGHLIWFGFTRASSSLDASTSAPESHPSSSSSILDKRESANIAPETHPNSSITTSSRSFDEHSKASTGLQSTGAMIVKDSGITLQEVATQAGLDELGVFNQECSQKMLLDLAKHCVDWKLIGRYLDLTEAEIVAVDEDNRTTDERRARMLERWKEKFAFKATYRVFIEALLACGRIGDAVDVCNAIAKNVMVTLSCGIEHLSKAFTLLLPLATEWENIGLCLGLNDFQDSIKTLAQTPPSCLRETLKLWLNRVDPPPTWRELAKAVEPFNSDIAAKITLQ